MQSSITHQRTSSDNPIAIPVHEMKPKTISPLKHYLIGCAHLLYITYDTRNEDVEEQTVGGVRRCYALQQQIIVDLYFDGIHRSNIALSRKVYSFAAPDWSLLEPYLFPWIRLNIRSRPGCLTKLHIRHVAFRIWEYLATHDGGVINVEKDQHNIPLDKIRGWWWDIDGGLPPNYMEWDRCYNGYLPGMCIIWH